MEDLKVTAKGTAKGYDFSQAHAAMQRYVDGNILSGVSSAVFVGRDLVDVNCTGWADKEAQTPLRADHIFRVFSNTKLVTSCAALLLLEEGKFKLDDPIETYTAWKPKSPAPRRRLAGRHRAGQELHHHPSPDEPQCGPELRILRSRHRHFQGLQ
jgi:CubicO group peptidase (beta-lactamase class C family)